MEKCCKKIPDKQKIAKQRVNVIPKSPMNQIHFYIIGNIKK